MNELNVFNNPYRFKNHPIRWLDWFCSSIKWAAQRVCRGYSDNDLVNMNDYYSNLLEQTLTSFANNVYSTPLEWDHDDWVKYLKDCSKLCYIMSGGGCRWTEADEEFSRLYDNVPPADSIDFLVWEEKVRKVNEILMKEEEEDQQRAADARKELFEKLDKVWDHLWD